MKRRTFLQTVIGAIATLFVPKSKASELATPDRAEQRPEWCNYTFSYSNMSDEEANRRFRKALEGFKGSKDRILHIDIGGNYTFVNRKSRYTNIKN